MMTGAMECWDNGLDPVASVTFTLRSQQLTFLLIDDRHSYAAERVFLYAWHGSPGAALI
jgi:hypothetical protein